MEFRVSRVEGVGFRASGLGFRVRVYGREIEDEEFGVGVFQG